MYLIFTKFINWTFFEKGDQDYVKYWNEVEANYENYVYSNIKDGFRKLDKGQAQVVMHALDAMAKGAHKSDPHSTPYIKTFASSKSSYYNLIFTENSPLLPMFKKAATESFETGQYDRISLKWQGDEIRSNDDRDRVLSSGQVFMNFIYLLCVFIVCLGFLISEILWFNAFDEISKGKQYCRDMLVLNSQKYKFWAKHQNRRHST